MYNLKSINERFAAIEKRLAKLESKRDAKETLAEILKSGYTNSDLQRLIDEIESGEKDSIFTEIVKELKTYNDAYDYYKSKSNGNLFECPELDNDLLDIANNVMSN